MVRLDAVSKVYSRGGQRIVAVPSCTLALEHGEFLTVTGPPGSGKSTLLAILGGLLVPTRGAVRLDGQSLYDLSAEERTRLRRQKIGFVFQAFNLVPYLTALENVQVPLYLAGVKPVEQRRRASTLLEQVGLGDHLGNRIRELSASQQQRVALARTLVNDPTLILADEPTSRLDAATREQMLGLLESLCYFGKIVVMATRDPRAASSAGRILRLAGGIARAAAA